MLLCSEIDHIMSRLTSITQELYFISLATVSITLVYRFSAKQSVSSSRKKRIAVFLNFGLSYACVSYSYVQWKTECKRSFISNLYQVVVTSPFIQERKKNLPMINIICYICYSGLWDWKCCICFSVFFKISFRYLPTLLLMTYAPLSCQNHNEHKSAQHSNMKTLQN